MILNLFLLLTLLLSSIPPSLPLQVPAGPSTLTVPWSPAFPTPFPAEKLPNIPPPPYLSIDHGTKRCGFAYTRSGFTCEELSIFRAPSGTKRIRRSYPKIKVDDLTPLMDHFYRLLTIYKPNAVIIGLPLHRNGTFSYQSNIVTQFAYNVLPLIPPHCQVYYIDERFTSSYVSADNGNRIEDIDSMCAVVMMEEFCEEGKGWDVREIKRREDEEREEEDWSEFAPIP
jgi:RNase H-fold protein (predicted Holliday junction resolvase)